MSQAYQCDICGELFKKARDRQLEVYVNRAGGHRAFIEIIVRLLPGGSPADICPKCFEAAIQAATAKVTPRKAAKS